MSKYKQKKKRKHNSHNTAKTSLSSSERTVHFWHNFWGLYYWILAGIIILIIGNKNFYYIGLSLSFILHGINWFYMIKKLPYHFNLIMLEKNRESTKNARRNYHPAQIKEWKHEAKISGLLEIFGGIIILILSIVDISS